VLPVSPAERKRRGETPLSEAVEGRRYSVTSLQTGVGPGKSLRVTSQNYDQTVSIELNTGSSILGRPAAEAVWLRPEVSR
jgi:DtxR family Mn-dependent transcriptional regulator